MQLLKASVFVIALALGILDNAESKSLKPANTYFKLCSRKDPKLLDECIKQSFIEMKPVLVKGISSLGMAPMDPLNIPKLDLQEGSGSFGLRIKATNFTMKGMSGYVVSRAHAVMDKKTFELEVDFTTPTFWMTSNYEMNGQILVIPVKGEGTVEFNTTEMDGVVNMKGRVEQRGEDEWIELDDFTFKTNLKGKASMWFNNLFNGDKRLGDATNQFLNENYKEAYDAYKHMPEGGLGVVMRDFADKVFKAYPVKQLFLD